MQSFQIAGFVNVSKRLQQEANQQILNGSWIESLFQLEFLT